jgi:hypothetical protein
MMDDELDKTWMDKVEDWMHNMGPRMGVPNFILLCLILWRVW